jgi:hypothetical protein
MTKFQSYNLEIIRFFIHVYVLNSANGQLQSQPSTNNRGQNNQWKQQNKEKWIG